MIWIDFEHKAPTDSIPNWDPSATTQQWVPWTQAQWDAWLAKSRHLLTELAALDEAGQRDARNALIDANSAHWGELKEWLLALSAGKCWFSEARELYSHYDVEHFRPKKEAKALNATVRDGYWWLAFNYMNLRACGNVGNRKKGGWFPLKDGSLCSSYSAQCEESEARYLLDPIDNDDVALLAFDEEGKVVPLPGISDWEQERVHETVRRLKLNEYAALAEARRKVWQQMSGLIDEFDYAIARNPTGCNPAAKATVSQIRTRMREMIQPTAELSSVARWCMRLRNQPRLWQLVA